MGTGYWIQYCLMFLIKLFFYGHTVLSDSNKRFLYDVGAYNTDDDDQNVKLPFFLNIYLVSS